MDIAATEVEGRPVLITIEEYLANPVDQRPAALRCAGTATGGQPCAGAAFARALRGGPIAPHFASLHHKPGCDHSAPRPALKPGSITPNVDTIPLQLIAAPRHGNASVEPRWPSSTARNGLNRSSRANLRTALRALAADDLPPELRVQWQDQRPLLAYEFFIHLASASTPRGTPRAYWGHISSAHHHEPTRSIHLIPRVGARIVITESTYKSLDLHAADAQTTLVGITALAIGPLRRSRSGRLYVLAAQPSEIVWL